MIIILDLLVIYLIDSHITNSSNRTNVGFCFENYMMWLWILHHVQQFLNRGRDKFQLDAHMLLKGNALVQGNLLATITWKAWLSLPALALMGCS